MIKRAFVIGANYKDLQYARSDAEAVLQSLHEQDYELPNFGPNNDEPKKTGRNNLQDALPDQRHDVDTIENKLGDLAGKCGLHDLFLFYFAGHGVVLGGELYLILDSSEEGKNNTMLSAYRILEKVQNDNNCRASYKIIILDCCHSGAIFNQANFTHGVNYYIMAAAEDTEVVPEIEYDNGQGRVLKGGFMSQHIAKALAGDVPAAANRRDKVTPFSLKEWMDEELHRFRTENDRFDIPQITLRGQSKKLAGFWLARLDEPPPEKRALVDAIDRQVEKLEFQAAEQKEKLTAVDRTIAHLSLPELTRRRLSKKLTRISQEWEKRENEIALLSDLLVDLNPSDVIAIDHTKQRIELREGKMEALEKEINELEEKLNL
jgi:hypothetical protein